jgi:hypothetical protein
MHAAAESDLYADLSGRPCLAEEVGSLSDSAYSRETAAKFLRLRLYSLLASGNPGCVWWCHTDFTCTDRIPYRWGEMEASGLGLFTTDSQVKPAGEEYRRFRPVIDAVGGHLSPVRREAAILLPRHVARGWQRYFNAYILAKRAGFEVRYVNEDADLSPYRLVIAPCPEGTQPYAFRGWDNMRDFARRGGVVYLSFNGVYLREFGESFGIDLNYRRRKESQEAMHGLDAEWRLPGRAEWELRFGLTEGRAVLTYPDGRPALVEHDYGQGKMVFFAEPAEVLLGDALHAYRNDQTHRVYDYLRRLAGIPMDVEVNDPEVQRTFHAINDSEAYVVLANHHPADTVIDAGLERKILKASFVNGDGKIAVEGKRMRVPMPALDGRVIHVKLD